MTTEVVSRISWSLYGVPTLVRPVLQGMRALNDLPFLLCPDHFRITQWTLEQFHRRGVVPFNIAARPAFMDSLLQMVLAGKGVGMFFDIEMAAHLRAGRVLPCGPAFDPVARVMVLGPRARSPEVAPVLALLRNAVRRQDELVAMQHSRLGRPGLLAVDDTWANRAHCCPNVRTDNKIVMTSARVLVYSSGSRAATFRRSRLDSRGTRPPVSTLYFSPDFGRGFFLSDDSRHAASRNPTRPVRAHAHRRSPRESRTANIGWRSRRRAFASWRAAATPSSCEAARVRARVTPTPRYVTAGAQIEPDVERACSARPS